MSYEETEMDISSILRPSAVENYIPTDQFTEDNTKTDSTIIESNLMIANEELMQQTCAMLAAALPPNFAGILPEGTILQISPETGVITVASLPGMEHLTSVESALTNGLEDPSRKNTNDDSLVPVEAQTKEQTILPEIDFSSLFTTSDVDDCESILVDQNEPIEGESPENVTNSIHNVQTSSSVEIYPKENESILSAVLQGIDVRTTTNTAVGDTQLGSTFEKKTSGDENIVVIDVSKPIQLAQNSLIVVNGQKCVLQHNVKSGEVIAYPVKEPEKEKKKKGRPKNTKIQKNLKHIREPPIEETFEESEFQGVGIVEVPTQDGSLIKRSCRRRKKARFLKDYETGNMQNELGSDVEDTSIAEDEGAEASSSSKRKTILKAKPVLQKKILKPSDQPVPLFSFLNTPKKKRGRPKRDTKEAVQGFLIQTRDGQDLMMQVPISNLPANMSLEEVARNIANSLNLVANQNKAINSGINKALPETAGQVPEINSTSNETQPGTMDQEGGSHDMCCETIDLITKPMEQLVSSSTDNNTPISSDNLKRSFFPPTLDKSDLANHETTNPGNTNMIEVTMEVESNGRKDLLDEALASVDNEITFGFESEVVGSGYSERIFVSNVSDAGPVFGDVLLNETVLSDEIVLNTGPSNDQSEFNESLMVNEAVLSTTSDHFEIVGVPVREDDGVAVTVTVPESTSPEFFKNRLPSILPKSGPSSNFDVEPVSDFLKVICCPECGHQSYAHAQHYEHLLTHAGSTGCKVCAFVSLSDESLIKHYREKHPKNICGTCNYKAEYPYQIKRHQYSHQGDSKIECPKCQKSFKDQFTLRVHLQMIHKPKELLYQCELCAKAFSRKYHLTRHLKNHDPIKSYKCQVCNYRASQRSDVQKHMKAHGELSYFCEICSKGFRLLQNHNLHMKRHTGDKSYQCGVCEFSSYTFTAVRKHIERRHSGSHALFCEVCGQIFKNKILLNEHEQKAECEMLVEEDPGEIECYEEDNPEDEEPTRSDDPSITESTENNLNTFSTTIDNCIFLPESPNDVDQITFYTSTDAQNQVTIFNNVNGGDKKVLESGQQMALVTGDNVVLVLDQGTPDC